MKLVEFTKVDGQPIYLSVDAIHAFYTVNININGALKDVTRIEYAYTSVIVVESRSTVYYLLGDR